MTQRSEILAYLQAGNSLSPLEALERFGCFRLASVVHALKREGHNIITEIGTSRRLGVVKHFAIYRLLGVPARDLFQEARLD